MPAWGVIFFIGVMIFIFYAIMFFQVVVIFSIMYKLTSIENDIAKNNFLDNHV